MSAPVSALVVAIAVLADAALSPPAATPTFFRHES